MDQFEEFIKRVGEWAADGNLTRGAITIGAAALAAVLTAWRVLRRKPATDNRVRIDAPANVAIRVDPAPVYKPYA